MLFATLGPTTRRIRLPRSGSGGGGATASASASSTTSVGAGGSSGSSAVADDGTEGAVVLDANAAGARNKGQEVLLTDTVGFISKLPTDLIAAFRATLEEVGQADVLIHVIATHANILLSIPNTSTNYAICYVMFSDV